VKRGDKIEINKIKQTIKNEIEVKQRIKNKIKK
jgi:hypothetical protein